MLAPSARVPPQGSVQEAHAPTLHAELPYEPESVPLVQVRASEVQELPQVTEAAW